MKLRKLWQGEISEAKKVFGNSIEYHRVFIGPSDSGVMTFAYYNLRFGWFYVIWSEVAVYNKNALMDKLQARTFIHEMVHVWQGQHETYPREYMLRSGLSQGKGVFDDVWDNGLQEAVKNAWQNGVGKTWHDYRGRTYAFSMNQMGVNNFNDFNVEQQASIVDSWYAPDVQNNHLKEPIPGGSRSMSDVRYPYITCNILAGLPNAQYVAVSSQGQSNSPLKKGADPTVKAIQDELVRLKYLDPKYADGFTGKNTSDAVRGFQKNNGLKVDGDFGGPNSATRKKLGVR
jgi:hypothetical protein